MEEQIYESANAQNIAICVREADLILKIQVHRRLHRKYLRTLL